MYKGENLIVNLVNVAVKPPCKPFNVMGKTALLNLNVREKTPCKPFDKFYGKTYLQTFYYYGTTSMQTFKLQSKLLANLLRENFYL